MLLFFHDADLSLSQISAVELVQAVREIPGVSGVHLIGIKWEEGVVRVAEAAGLLPRPTLSPLATVGGRG